MESNLRKKMIVLVALSVALVFAITTALVWIFSRASIDTDADTVTQLIADNNDIMPIFDDSYKKDVIMDKSQLNLSINEDTSYSIRYFVIDLDYDGNLVNANTDKIASVSKNEAYKMAYQAYNEKKVVGNIYKYRYRSVPKFDMISYIFLDCRIEIERLDYYAVIFIVVELVFFVLINLVFAFVSKKVTKPFIENHKLQKQFITDAGHELKTPLAIISANADVLEYKTQGNAKWINAIKEQVANMSDLISELITLSKLEEVKSNVGNERFCLSNSLNDLVEDYNEVFIEKGIAVQTHVQDGIYIFNDKVSIEKICSILMDNATKHVPDKGILKIELIKYLKSAKLVISNTDDNNKKIDTNKLFERFYRTDKSRNSQSGGHGIGLSIAKRLCNQTSCNISAKQKNNLMIFTVVFSNKNKIIDLAKKKKN